LGIDVSRDVELSRARDECPAARAAGLSRESSWSPEPPIDAATFTAWKTWVAPRHPKVASAGMWAMAGFRAYLVFHNLRNEQKALRRTP
jgi:hypothetical protein